MTHWRFVHAADLHLDSPFVGLKELKEDLARDLVNATFAGLKAVVELCLESQAEFLLLAGDLFDNPQGSLKAQLSLRRELARLAAAGIETFIVHGNHDHLGGRGVTLEWPPGVTIFPSQQVEMFAVRRGGATLARIYGLSHDTPTESGNLTQKFPVADKGPLAIGLLHANLDRNPEHDNYAPCTLTDLARVSYDYWALGHIHQPGVRRAAQPAVVYAGNPQGRHLKEAGPRGCYLVEVDGHLLRPQFKPTAAIPWLELQVNVSGVEKLDRVAALLQGTLEGQRPQPPFLGAVLRLSLQGRGPVHRDLMLPGTLTELLEDLRQQGQGAHPWVWAESLTTATAPLFDLTALSQGQNLVATLLQSVAAARPTLEMPEDLQRLLEPLYHHHLARRYLSGPPPWPELLDDITSQLLGRLLPEGE